MCDPATVGITTAQLATGAAGAQAGLGILGAVNSFISGSDAANIANRQKAENDRDAVIAANEKYFQNNQRYIYDSRMVQQEGYKAAMAGRVAQGTAIASAGSSGFDTSSLSVQNILNDERQKTAMDVENARTKMDDLKDATINNNRAAYAEARGRINSHQYQAGPNPLALGINIAGAGVGAYGTYRRLQ